VLRITDPGMHGNYGRRELFFVQYAPYEITFPKPEVFDVTIVPRDREWFKTNLPIMDAFWKRVLYFREHLDECPKEKEKVKRPRKKKEPEPVVCEIEALPEEDFIMMIEEFLHVLSKLC